MKNNLTNSKNPEGKFSQRFPSSLSSRKRDLLFLGAVLVLCGLGLFLRAVLPLHSSATDANVVITAGGEVLGRFPLQEDRILIFQNGALKEEPEASSEALLTQETNTGEESYNRIEIADGRVRCTEANCPDQICVHTAALDGGTDGNPIACLPHQLVISLE